MSCSATSATDATPRSVSQRQYASRSRRYAVSVLGERPRSTASQVSSSSASSGSSKGGASSGVGESLTGQHQADDRLRVGDLARGDEAEHVVETDPLDLHR